MTTIVNYGTGNLYSVKKAFEMFDNNVVISDKIWDIRQADRIVLPGVGHFKNVITTIKTSGIFEVLIEEGKNKPFLGICLGMQILFEKGEEGDIDGMCLLKGKVVRFSNKVKVPHIGWNTVRFKPHPIFNEISQDSWFYFVHSYYPVPDEDVTFGVTPYGDVEFASVILKDNIIGCQFHPEKSSKAGLKFIENFVKL